MRIINVLILFLITACATFSDKNVVYKPSNIGKTDKPILITLKANFHTQLGFKYASLTRKNVMSGIDNCIMTQPGEGNDGYLKSVLCKTYFSLSKSFNLKLVESRTEIESNEVFNIRFELKEGVGIGEQIWSWSNFLTLTVIPYRGKRDFKTVINLTRAGNLVKDISSQASFIEWRSIFLLPAMPFVDGYQVGTEKVLASQIARLDSFILENLTDKLK